MRGTTSVCMFQHARSILNAEYVYSYCNSEYLLKSVCSDVFHQCFHHTIVAVRDRIGISLSSNLFLPVHYTLNESFFQR